MENEKKFSPGTAFVVKETEEIVELVRYTERDGEPAVEIVGEEGDPGWHYLDEVVDFNTWIIDEMDYDF